MDTVTEPVVIRSGTQRTVGGELVSVSGVLPVREHDGTIRDRAMVRAAGDRTEVFEGDEVTLAGTRYVVAIDVVAANITLTPVTS